MAKGGQEEGNMGTGKKKGEEATKEGKEKKPVKQKVEEENEQ